MPSTPLQMRRQRVRLIRRRVVGAAAATFMASTGWILVQLVSGHDPALARGQTTTRSTIATASVASGSSPSSASSSSSSNSNSNSSGSSPSGSATAVTTRAS